MYSLSCGCVVGNVFVLFIGRGSVRFYSKWFSVDRFLPFFLGGGGMRSYCIYVDSGYVIIFTDHFRI